MHPLEWMFSVQYLRSAELHAKTAFMRLMKALSRLRHLQSDECLYCLLVEPFANISRNREGPVQTAQVRNLIRVLRCSHMTYIVIFAGSKYYVWYK